MLPTKLIFVTKVQYARTLLWLEYLENSVEQCKGVFHEGDACCAIGAFHKVFPDKWREAEQSGLTFLHFFTGVEPSIFANRNQNMSIIYMNDRANFSFKKIAERFRDTVLVDMRVTDF